MVAVNPVPLLVAYLTLTFILAATPGSTTAVVVRNTLSSGLRAGLAAAAGAAFGNTTQATASGLGLALLVTRVPSAIVVLHVFGAAYLVWLGASGIWKVLIAREPGVHLSAVAENGRTSHEHRASFRQGLTVNLLNPTISTFYLVVVPSFIPAGAPGWYYAMLAAMHITIAFACHASWALAFDRLREFFENPSARRVLEVGAGVAMIGLAVRVLMQS